MFHIGTKTSFVGTVRVVGLLVVLAAIAYGIYVARFQSVSTGLVWIMSAVAVGWVSNMVFSLLLVLISDARKSSARHTANYAETAHNRYRRLHLGIGTQKTR